MKTTFTTLFALIAMSCAVPAFGNGLAEARAVSNGGTAIAAAEGHGNATVRSHAGANGGFARARGFGSGNADVSSSAITTGGHSDADSRGVSDGHSHVRSKAIAASVHGVAIANDTAYATLGGRAGSQSSAISHGGHAYAIGDSRARGAGVSNNQSYAETDYGIATSRGGSLANGFDGGTANSASNATSFASPGQTAESTTKSVAEAYDGGHSEAAATYFDIR